MRRASSRHRRGVDHRQARRPGRREPHRVRQVPAAPHRRARMRPRPLRRRRETLAPGEDDLRHHRLGRPSALAVARPRVRPGGHRLQARGRDLDPADGRRHRAGRRGRQDHLLRFGYRAAHERHVRGRHRGVHRPDGDTAPYRRERAQRARGGCDHDLPHREPLRRLRQDRRAAAAQRGRASGGRGCLDFPGSGDADHLRPRLRPSHPRTRRLPGRPAPVPLRAAPPLLPHARPR